MRFGNSSERVINESVMFTTERALTIREVDYLETKNLFRSCISVVQNLFVERY